MKKRVLLSVAAALLAATLLASCGSAPEADGDYDNWPFGPSNYFDATVGKGDASIGEEEGQIKENAFVDADVENVSTFSADVDTASYAYFRKLVNSGYGLGDIISLAGKSMRTEEFVNYFAYGYRDPDGDDIFGVRSRIAACPWNEETMLMCLNLKAKSAVPAEGNNLVFLIDVSGSMNSEDKLQLIKKSFEYLIGNLTGNDIVSIVTYSGKEEVVLDGCPGLQADRIRSAVAGLVASGSTNGEAGLSKAYDVAKSHFIEGGNNRIIMASDGDLNVGITSVEELKSFVEDKRNDGIYLSVMGFGTGNYKDAKMEALADNGNGVYYYIDGVVEAEKVFGTDLFATLYTVAEDVKFQLTFNRDVIREYRLIGYENRVLNNEDFLDDDKDAGEVGAGHTVTVLYEIRLKDTADTEALEDPLVSLAVNLKLPGSGERQLRTYEIRKEDIVTAPDADLAFISCVVKTTMILRKSVYLAGRENYSPIDELGKVRDELSALDLSGDGYKAEFLSLIGMLLTRE